MKSSKFSFLKIFCLMLGFCIVCSSVYAEIVQIDFPGAQSTIPGKINNYGIMVGTYRMLEGDAHVFVYDLNQPEGSRFTTIDTDFNSLLPGIEIVTLSASTINDVGTIVGFYVVDDPTDGPTTRGFVYEEGVLSLFDYPGAWETYLTDINHNGEITGLYKTSVSEGYGFLYDPSLLEGERFKPITHPGEYDTLLFGMNDNGALVGGYGTWSVPANGFIYDIATATFTDFWIPGNEDVGIYALDINNSNIVVGCYNAVGEAGYNQGYVYDPSNPENSRFPFFDYPPEANLTIVGINDNGYMTGMYNGENNNIRGFLYIPDPVTLCEEDDTGAIDIMGQAACASDTQTIRVPIRIQNAYKPDPRNPVDAFGFEVTYDPAVLSFVAFERDDLLLGFDDVVEVIDVDHNEVETGVVRIGGFTTVNPIGPDQEGMLGHLVFYSNQAVSTSLGIQNMVDDIALWPASGACLNPATGDINRDGEVTPADALCAFEKAINICATTCGPCDTVPCDVDRDCLCSASDSLCIFNRYLGIPSCLDE